MSKPNATRKPYSRKVSLEMTNSLVDRMLSQKQREIYLAQKQEYNNSFIGQVDQTCRGLLQETSKEIDEINRMYVETVSKLADKAIDTTKELLLEQYGDLDSLTLEQIEEFLRYANIMFKKVETMCNSPQYTSVVKNNQSSDYERIYKRLIEEINPQFIVFAPDKIIEIRRVFKGMTRMPIEAKVKLFQRVKEKGLDRDCKYMESHENVFNEVLQPKQIETKAEETSIEA